MSEDLMSDPVMAMPLAAPPVPSLHSIYGTCFEFSLISKLTEIPAGVQKETEVSRILNRPTNNGSESFVSGITHVDSTTNMIVSGHVVKDGIIYETKKSEQHVLRETVGVRAHCSGRLSRIIRFFSNFHYRKVTYLWT